MELESVMISLQSSEEDLKCMMKVDVHVVFFPTDVCILCIKRRYAESFRSSS